MQKVITCWMVEVWGQIGYAGAEKFAKNDVFLNFAWEGRVGPGRDPKIWTPRMTLRSIGILEHRKRSQECSWPPPPPTAFYGLSLCDFSSFFLILRKIRFRIDWKWFQKDRSKDGGGIHEKRCFLDFCVGGKSQTGSGPQNSWSP